MNYFETNEKNDYNLLLKLNEKHKWFEELRQTKQGHHTDAIGKHKDRIFNIELKRRYITTKTYNSIYIEDYKMCQMLLDYQFYKIEPLYINFLNDAVVIYNLKDLKTYPKVEIKNINSQGKERTQLQTRRYCLPLTNAVIIYYNE